MQTSSAIWIYHSISVYFELTVYEWYECDLGRRKSNGGGSATKLVMLVDFDVVDELRSVCVLYTSRVVCTLICCIAYYMRWYEWWLCVAYRILSLLPFPICKALYVFIYMCMSVFGGPSSIKLFWEFACETVLTIHTHTHERAYAKLRFVN